MCLETRLVSQRIVQFHKFLYRLIVLPVGCFNYLIHRYRGSSGLRGVNKFPELIAAKDITQLCLYHGYSIQEHVVQTKDGYLLTLHRVTKHGASPVNKPIVYFHHGLLTNSEIFVLGETSSKCLPFRLFELGYDVWLGNNRGNKYSRKHIKLSCSHSPFWNYSIDEFAIYDVPAIISHILTITSQADLIYVGFSQGSAQALAALSISSELNRQIRLFIGLSPAMIPQPLVNPLATIFIRFPTLLYILLGKKAVLPSLIAFSGTFLGPLYRLIIDFTLNFVFCWRTKNISKEQKQIGYPHLFSLSSVKSLVHWLQIIKNDRFQMYDNVRHSVVSRITSTGFKLHKPTSFPINTITTRVMLVYGKSDILIKIEDMLGGLTNSKELTMLGVEGYEHMDTLWARSVEQTVFQPVLKKIRESTMTTKDKDTANSSVSPIGAITSGPDNINASSYTELIQRLVALEHNFSRDWILHDDELPRSQSSVFV